MSSLELDFSNWERLRREFIWIRKSPPITKDAEYQPRDATVAWRILRGCVKFTGPFGTLNIKEGKWIFPGNIAGHRCFSDNAEMIMIRFRAVWPTGQDLFDHSQPLLSEPTACRKLDQGVSAVIKCFHKKLIYEGVMFSQAELDFPSYLAVRNGCERWFQAYAESMMDLGQRPHATPLLDKRIENAIRLMSAQLQSRLMLTERQMAAQVGLSLSHFKRLFLQHLGKTPRKWLEAKRYEMACHYLLQSPFPIKRMSYELGFRSPNHFSSWFLKLSGKTPVNFREGSHQET